MKIIGEDNYGRLDVADKMVVENVSEASGEMIVQALNAHQEDGWFYKLYPDDYPPYQPTTPKGPQ